MPLTEKQQAVLRKSFTPPLILLKALSEACAQGERKADHPPHNPNQSEEDKFKAFVNKVAQICDSRPHGPTVSGCTVLVQENGRVLYMLASNDRKFKTLREMAAHLVSILEVLKDNVLARPEDRETDDRMNGQLLRLVLSFNHVRVQTYVSELSQQLKKCIKACKRSPSDESECPPSLLRLI